MRRQGPLRGNTQAAPATFNMPAAHMQPLKVWVGVRVVANVCDKVVDVFCVFDELFKEVLIYLVFLT